VAAAALILPAVATASGTPVGTVTTYAVPTSGAQPGGIVEGPDGAMWFTETGADRIGRITSNGVITEYALPNGTAPAGIIDGGPWGGLLVADGNGDITHIDTDGTTYDFYPGGSSMESLALAPDGAIWFTDPVDEEVGNLETDLTTTTWSVSNPPQAALFANGEFWWTEPTANAVAHFSGGQLYESGSWHQPAGLIAGPDGNLWFGDLHGIGQWDLAGNAANEFWSGGITHAAGAALAADGRFWITDDTGQQVARWDMTTNQWTLFPASGDATSIAPGPDGTLWVTEPGANAIIRVAAAALPSLSATTASFGAQALGTTSDQSVMLTNDGSADEALSGLTFTGADTADFSVMAGGSGACDATTVLAAGASCTATIRFTPSRVAAESATLSIADDTAGSPFAVALDGTGLAAPAAVTSGAATDVTRDGAALSAAATPNGSATSAWFEYGTTTGYGATTAAQDLGDGVAGVAADATLTGLTAATTYHARLVAHNGVATTHGADFTFTTAQAPAGPAPAAPARPSAPPAAATTPAAGPPAAPVITKAPPAISAAKAQSVAFTVAAGASAQCRVDGGAWVACTSPFVVTRLRSGERGVDVRAVDAGGDASAPAQARFQVNLHAPKVTVKPRTLTVGPAGAVTVPITCSAREGGGHGACLGTVALVLHGRAVARGTFRAAAGRTDMVRLTLPASARRTRGRVTLAVDVSDLAGNHARTSLVRTLR
jgi:virginiamycin B lyase